jgi:hypothetical protein
MKIEIEKVQKIKPFEPFIVKMQFDSPEEARELLYEMDNVLDILDDYGKEGKILVRPIKAAIKEELKQQGYVS